MSKESLYTEVEAMAPDSNEMKARRGRKNKIRLSSKQA